MLRDEVGVRGADAFETAVQVSFDGRQWQAHGFGDLGKLKLLDIAEEKDGALARCELLDRLPDLRERLVCDELLFGVAAVVRQTRGEGVCVDRGGGGPLPEAEVLGTGVRAEQVERDACDPCGYGAVAAEAGPRGPDLEEGFLGKGEGEIAVSRGHKEEPEDAGFIEGVDPGEVVERRG